MKTCQSTKKRVLANTLYNIKTLEALLSYSLPIQNCIATTLHKVKRHQTRPSENYTPERKYQCTTKYTPSIPNSLATLKPTPDTNFKLPSPNTT